MLLGAIITPGDSLDFPSDDLLLAGGVTAGVGGAMLITGIVLVATSGTSVDIESGSKAGDSASLFEIDKRTTARAPRYWLGEF